MSIVILGLMLTWISVISSRGTHIITCVHPLLVSEANLWTRWRVIRFSCRFPQHPPGRGGVTVGIQYVSTYLVLFRWSVCSCRSLGGCRREYGTYFITFRSSTYVHSYFCLGFLMTYRHCNFLSITQPIKLYD